MEYRTLGGTGLRVSAIGYGCAGLRPASIDYAVQIVHRALDLGITFFDNARGYGDAETKLGIALEGRRDEAVVSTKTTATTRDDAWRGIEESLARLCTDHLDNMHLHNLHSMESMEERLGPGGALESLVEAREQGIIAHVGCTGHRNEVLAEAIRRFPFEVVLCVFNFAVRDPLDELIPLCVERNVGVTVMKGLSKGRLPVALALKWLLAQPVHSVVPGAVSLDEIEESAAVGNGDLPLTDEERESAEAVAAEVAGECCDICGRCLPCPAEIGIPGVLGTDGRLFTYRAHGLDGYRDYRWSSDYVAEDLESRERTVAAIEACNDCGECEARCPRHLPVVDLLRASLPVHRGIIATYREVLGP